MKKKSSGWIPVEESLPPCSRSEEALGTPVLVWPRSGEDSGHDGLAYFGRRATGRPAFYIYGTQLYHVTHWMSLPPGP